MELDRDLQQLGVAHRMDHRNNPVLIKCLEAVYVVYYALLYPFYYFWNKRDFSRQTKKNPFYVSKLVRLIEKHPLLYELSMYVLNFPHPTSVYRFFPPMEGKVLQVGCGTGLLNKWARHMGGAEFVNLDINERYLQYGLKKGRYQNTVHSGIYDVPLEDESFDIIVFARCFHHIRHHKKAFKECARLLKDGGQIWIADPVILQEEGSGKQMNAGYMANSSIDGVIWRFTKPAFVKHLADSLSESLRLVSITDVRQPHMTNYNLKYPQTDILAVIEKTADAPK
ncbi:class I SAM-dependent methyltransferase [Paenibacillus hamazuiensis]|uniref:class I SAM-dependent methyltransferase n=1 Tax=Paenibacillus hamazuiensis TaxID=2936508 RepID=UPI00200D114E|nr:class I SAM-dependent methyltransferase [Paenibacillus hamazuiensis]